MNKKSREISGESEGRDACARVLFSVGGFSVTVTFEQRLKEVWKATVWLSRREFLAEGRAEAAALK